MHGHLFAIAVAIMWGLAAILQNSLVKKYNPSFLYVITGLTFGVSAILVFFWKRSAIVPMFKIVTLTDFSAAILMALGAVAIANYVFLLAFEKSSSPTAVTALAYCAPIFTLLGSILLLKYPVSFLELIGIFTTITGVVIVSLSARRPR